LPRVVLTLLAFFQCLAFAKDITTNEVVMKGAPDWLKQPRVEKVIDHIQLHLKPTGPRVTATWYATEEAYDKKVPYGAASLAVTMYDGGSPSIHIGPQVNEKNFDETFGHELVHVIIYQKYKGRIPKWLEEGMANFFASKDKVDYKWLASQPFPNDVKELAHPFQGAAAQIQYRYKASQAFCEMLAKKCDLERLVELSTDQHGMEDYMRTYCEIKDLNKAFQDWVKSKSKGGAVAASSN